MSIKLHDTYEHDKEMILVEDAVYGASSDIGHELYYSTIFRFLNEYGF